MPRSDTREPEGSSAPVSPACAACREELQLQVAYCPFCGTLQAAPQGQIDKLSIAKLLDDVDWSSEMAPLVSPAPAEEARPSTAASSPLGLPSPPSPPSPLDIAIAPGDREQQPERLRDPVGATAVPETEPKGGRSKRRLVVVALSAVICAALFARYSPPASTHSKGEDTAPVQPSAPLAVPVPVPMPVPGPGPTARSIPPATKPPPEPSRISMRLSKAWKTVRLGPDGDRTSTSFEGSGAFRIRAGGKLYVVDGSTPVELDLRGLADVDLRAVAGSVTVDIVASRDRSLVGN